MQSHAVCEPKIFTAHWILNFCIFTLTAYMLKKAQELPLATQKN